LLTLNLKELFVVDRGKMLELYYRFLRDLDESIKTGKAEPVTLDVYLKDGARCCIKLEVKEVRPRLAIVKDEGG
jgi:hypothetical protein